MRRGEVQHNRDFKQREVPLPQRRGQEALARDVTVDVVTQLRMGRSLRSLPATELGRVAGDFDGRRTDRSHSL